MNNYNNIAVKNIVAIVDDVYPVIAAKTTEPIAKEKIFTIIPMENRFSGLLSNNLKIFGKYYIEATCLFLIDPLLGLAVSAMLSATSCTIPALNYNRVKYTLAGVLPLSP